MKKALCVLFSLVFTVSCFATCVTATDKTLKFRDDGTFKILHITDTQDDQYPAYDMLNFLKKSIAAADPDLIVFTGDLVEDSRIGDIGIDDESFREGVVVKTNGEIDHDKSLENIKIAAGYVLDIFEESGVPYVIAQGNNDRKCGISNAEWLEIYSEYDNCLVTDKSNDAGGAIDCNLEIKDKTGKTVFNIWTMDTGGHSVSDEQISWYMAQSDELKTANGGKPVPSLLFQHVHIDDIGNLFVECKPWDDGAKAIGLKFYRLNKKIAGGYNTLAYAPCEPGKEFKAWKEQGDVLGAFFGHQHFDGFSGVVDGIELGFTYGCEMAKPGPYGYRLFTLHEDDIKNYDNEVFRYTGKVKLGTDKITKQEDPVYDEYSNIIEQLAAYIKNTAISLISILVSLFA